VNELQFYNLLLAFWFALAAIIACILVFVKAPYGRYTRGGWGPAIRDRWGWIIMEAPSAILFALFFFTAQHRTGAVAIIFVVMWEIHYVYRSLIFAPRIRGRQKHMPFSVIAMGLLFNTGNCYLNGRYLFTFAASYSASWLHDGRFIAGCILFLCGFLIHVRSDAVLRSLRSPGASGYAIPRGGLYTWISCPNYLGEIVEWTGWALATWSLPGLAFAVWTIANLAPRAAAHHAWYRGHFSDYPKNRKALIPGVW
jgi:protein-S-isoprenylcysteine O-methyltransferase Ste14